MKALKIKNQTETQSELYIYGDIVSSEWDRWQMEDVAPESVKAFLDTIKGKDLKIYVNSGGGSVFAGLAIYNMLKRHDGQKTVYVDGLAGSIASVIALAGDKVIIPKNAFLMIHKPWVSLAGNSVDLRKMAGDLDRIEEGILNVYAENLRDGVDMAVIKSMVTKETWLSGESAAEYFNIETSDSLDAVACVSDYFKNYADIPSDIIQEVVQDEVEVAQELKQEEEIIEVSNTHNKSELEEILLAIDLL